MLVTYLPERSFSTCRHGILFSVEPTDDIYLMTADQLRAALLEARAWARGYETGLFAVDTNNPPAWLIAPLEA